MSRWSRRTQEEKDAIAKKQQALADNSKKATTARMADDRTKEATEVYEKMELPIRCHRCFRWSGSDKYEIRIDNFEAIGAGRLSVVAGQCRHCGTHIKRVLKAGPLELDAMVLFKLTNEGRVTDKRPKEGQCPACRKPTALCICERMD